MYYHEKQNYVNIFSGILIAAVYAIIVYNKHVSGSIDLKEDYRVWGYLLLIFMAVSIVARIIIQIIFHIFNVIITREEDIPKKDERDKLIALKATRNSHYSISGVLFISIKVCRFNSVHI